jgi:hypothetical protein
MSKEHHTGLKEVVLRFSDEQGVVDMTDVEALDAHKSFVTFTRDASGGIGERAHRFAFITQVVPLEGDEYRLEDRWHAHPLMLGDNEEPVGGIAFGDVFRAERLPDGSLRFDRLIRKGHWRVLNLFLGHLFGSPSLAPVAATIEQYGGFAEEDPWIGGGWLWIFLPPDTDYDPMPDIRGAIRAIAPDEKAHAYEQWQKRWQVRTDEK